MGRLRSSEYMPYATAHRGTERVNHDDCPAGTDNKRRLYVTRKEDGHVVAYCHNCGNSGANSGTSRFRLASVPKTSTTSEGHLEMSELFEEKSCKWPKEMMVWLNKCGISLTIAEKYGIVYDSDDRRIIIPTLDKSGDLVMFQSRRLYEDGTPKYLTYKEKGAYYHTALPGKGTILYPNTCIIVEDMVSAIRCAEAGLTTVPLFTSTMTDSTLLTIKVEYDTIVVWLDNDNATVDQHAENLVRKARLIGLKAVRVCEHTDPKHYENRKIIHIINEVLR